MGLGALELEALEALALEQALALPEVGAESDLSEPPRGGRLCQFDSGWHRSDWFLRLELVLPLGLPMQ